MIITKDMTMDKIINANNLTLLILKKYDMLCGDCAAKFHSTIEECANTHNADLEKLIGELQKLV